MPPGLIVNRPKHPSRSPIRQCLLPRNGAGIPEPLSERALERAGLFDPRKVGMLIRKMKTVPEASEVDSMALAGVLSAQMVHERFVERFSPVRETAGAPNVLVDRRSMFSK